MFGQKVLRLVQALAAVWLCLIGIITAVRLFRGGIIDYQMSEWMIGYGSGFIRRGLGGELMKGLAHLTGLDGLTVIIWLSATTLLLFIVGFARRVVRIPGLNENEKFALLFMPPGLSFVLLNTNVLLRKEYLAFLVFFGFLALQERGRREFRWLSGIYLSILGTFAVLVHELFFFLFLPYCSLLLWARASRERPGMSWVLPLVAPGLAAILGMLAPPPQYAPERLCADAQTYVRTLPCVITSSSAFYFAGAGKGGALESALRELIRTKVGGLPVVIWWAVAYAMFTWIHYQILWRAVKGWIGESRCGEAKTVATVLCGLNTALAAGMALISFDLGRWFFVLAALATLTVSSRSCAEDLAEMVRRAGKKWELPNASPGTYSALVVFGGLAPLIFQYQHCCAYRGIEFFWFLRDILVHYGIIPEHVDPVLAIIGSRIAG